VQSPDLVSRGRWSRRLYSSSPTRSPMTSLRAVTPPAGKHGPTVRSAMNNDVTGASPGLAPPASGISPPASTKPGRGAARRPNAFYWGSLDGSRIPLERRHHFRNYGSASTRARAAGSGRAYPSSSSGGDYPYDPRLQHRRLGDRQLPARAEALRYRARLERALGLSQAAAGGHAGFLRGLRGPLRRAASNPQAGLARLLDRRHRLDRL
jgi:hypothetical protein